MPRKPKTPTTPLISPEVIAAALAIIEAQKGNSAKTEAIPEVKPKEFLPQSAKELKDSDLLEAMPVRQMAPMIERDACQPVLRYQLTISRGLDNGLIKLKAVLESVDGFHKNEQYADTKEPVDEAEAAKVLTEMLAKDIFREYWGKYQQRKLVPIQDNRTAVVATSVNPINNSQSML